jgi:hypothetical protein
LALLKQGADLKFTLLVNTVLLGFYLILFAHTNYFPLDVLFATLRGFGTLSQTSVCNTIVRIEADKNMKARVISYLAMSVFACYHWPVCLLVLYPSE